MLVWAQPDDAVGAASGAKGALGSGAAVTTGALDATADTGIDGCAVAPQATSGIEA